MKDVVRLWQRHANASSYTMLGPQRQRRQAGPSPGVLATGAGFW
ncbi:hypothetical protein DWUX_2359 [Desulfovibrio diazotrophicus]|nr:hypothetical protein DWUX_2359 [Desulfovibrio diazotrophicus]